MATVREILAVKGSQVVKIGSEATVYEAAVAMNDHRIGGLVVDDGQGVSGMITERDILRRVVAERRDPTQTRVRDVMTTNVICGHLHTSVEEARVVMKDRRIRHLPIMDGQNQLCGLISIGDLNAHEAQSKDLTIHLLNQYIHGFASVPGEA